MNGSDTVPSWLEPLENWATRTGLEATMWLGPDRTRWWTWPRARVATSVPLTTTSVPSAPAKKRKVSPPVRVARPMAAKLVPQVVVGVSCSTRWSQA